MKCRILEYKEVNRIDLKELLTEKVWKKEEALPFLLTF